MTKQKFKNKPFDDAIADQISQVFDYEAIKKENKIDTRSTPNRDGVEPDTTQDRNKVETDTAQDRTETEPDTTPDRNKVEPDTESTIGRVEVEPDPILSLSEVDTGSKHQKDTQKTPDRIELDPTLDRHRSIELTEKRYLVYNWFVERGYEGAYVSTDISKAVSVSLSVVKRTIDALRNTGILKDKYKPHLLYSSYSIDRNIKVSGPIMKEKRHRVGTTLIPDRPSSNKQASFFNALNNKACLPIDFDKILNEDPEFEFWRKQNLTVEKIMSKAKEFPKISFDDWIDYYKKAACKLIDIDCKTTKGEPIQNPIQWFFHIIKNDGHFEYKKYKPLEVKEAERLEKRLNQKKATLDKLKNLREKEALIDAELEFENIIKNPSMENTDFVGLIENLHSGKGKKKITDTLKTGRNLDATYIKKLLGAHLQKFKEKPHE